VSREASAAFLSFTEVLDGRFDEFERWHALDHMPEQFGIEGIVAAQRWSADPAPAPPWMGRDSSLAAAHHVHVYLIADPVLPALEEMGTLAADLTAQARWFEGRRGLFNAPFAVTGRSAATAAPVRARVVPYRPNQGVFVALFDPPPDQAPAERVDALSTRLVAVDGVAGCWTFEAIPPERLPPRMPCAPTGTRFALAWLDRDPDEVWPALTASLDATADRARPLRFASVYRTRTARAGV
jgi:hypothetical protein